MQTPNTFQDRPGFMASGGGDGGYVPNRLRSFGVTLAVMGACFALYYMGLFGGVSGPLEPASIGDRLASLGFTRSHLLGMLLALTFVSIIWNWVYNALNRRLGWNLRCTAILNHSGESCGEPIVDRTGQKPGRRYICRAGHACRQAYAPALKKGTLSHFLWMMFLIFSAIVYYHMA